MRKFHTKFTVSDIHEDLHPLKRVLVHEFDHLTTSKILNLPNNKRRSLTDFVSCIPQTTARACTTDRIKHGFLANGMIDLGTSRYPYFDKMLATCRSNIPTEQHSLCLTFFPTLLKTFSEKSHIPDSVFAELGFNPGVNPDGNEVHHLHIGAEGRC